MPSNRRVKFLMACAAFAVLLILYLSSEARNSQDTDFYHRTSAALDAKKKAADDVAMKAEADAQLQKIVAHAQDIAGGDNVAEVANAMGEQVDETESRLLPSRLENAALNTEQEETSVAGRKMMPKPKEKPKWDTSSGEEQAFNGGKIEQVEEPGMSEAKAELNLILKKSPSKSAGHLGSISYTSRISGPREFAICGITVANLLLLRPVIIFSKTHCPHSRRAKSLLLDTYHIVPAPYVVELDALTTPISLPASQHSEDGPAPTLGRKLQDLLAQNTGRKTVPNILINGKSIGGADDVVKLNEDGLLLKKIKDMGGRWVHEVGMRATGT